MSGLTGREWRATSSISCSKVLRSESRPSGRIVMKWQPARLPGAQGTEGGDPSALEGTVHSPKRWWSPCAFSGLCTSPNICEWTESECEKSGHVGGSLWSLHPGVIHALDNVRSPEPEALTLHRNKMRNRSS